MRYATLTAFLYVAVLCVGCAGTRTEGSIPDVLAPGAQVELVRENFVFTEGPVGTADSGLLFTDLRGSRIYYLDTRGAISLYRHQTNETNGLALTRNGAAETGAKRISISSSGGAARELTRGDGTKPLVAINDLIVADNGGIYFTDPALRPIVPGRKGLCVLPAAGCDTGVRRR
jgi:sugar lactone lactonase YvrE